MISSMRFRNSGLNDARSALSICSLTSGRVTSSTSRMNCEPTFEVMMMTVFLKSTVRPCPSVSRPSSST